MSDDQLKELLKYCSPHIIYVVNSKNRIIKLHTPFKLLVLHKIGNLNSDQIVECTMIKITREGKMVFCIDGKNYFPYHFEVLAI